MKTEIGEINDSIKNSEAAYIQVIHTTQSVGNWDQIGDIDIYVRFEEDVIGGVAEKHAIAFVMHLVTSTKRLSIKAELNENGVGTILSYDRWLWNGCELGVYGKLHGYQQGKKFGLLLNKFNMIRFSEILKSFWGNPEDEKVEENESDQSQDECILCCENKKNAILRPCNHQEICVPCWIKWLNEPSSEGKCPVCRQEVHECIADN